MGWKLSTAFLNNEDEWEVLDEYGLCCGTPALQVLYSIKDENKDKPKEGFFICYECFLCGQSLYISSKVGHTPHVWV